MGTFNFVREAQILINSKIVERSPAPLDPAARAIEVKRDIRTCFPHPVL
jgi:hypothetical protein